DEAHTFGGNANIIMFHDDGWDDAANGVIALTTVSFGKTSGRIYDADIEINGLNTITTDATRDTVTGYDLQSILTHESGHFMGLAHAILSCSPAAGDCPTMSPNYPPNSIDFRTLEMDDINGICAIYPTGRLANDDTCEPCNGFASECGTDVAPANASYPMNCAIIDPSGGCSVARGPGDSGLTAPAEIGGACLALLALRRRKRGRPA
ncbi:MAG TPA: matrixin family metalloprotease, partial [Polyangiaceae bacterium]